MNGRSNGAGHDSPPAEFVAYAGLPLPLGTPVYVAAERIVGVISGRSTCDGQRWRVTWFCRRDRRVVHGWFAQSEFTLIGAAENAADAAALSA